MADHLKLTTLDPMRSKRVNVNFDPGAPKPDRGARATTLRGILEGLASSHLFPALGDAGEIIEPEESESGISELVLKFTGTQPFDNSAFKGLGLVPLAVTDDKRYFALTDHDARSALARLIGRYSQPEDSLDGIAKNLQNELAKVDGIDLYGREDRLAPGLQPPSNDDVVEVDVALWPTSLEHRTGQQQGTERVARIISLLESHTDRNPLVRLLAHDSRDPDRLTVHVAIDAIAFEELADHHLIERIRGPLTARVTHETLLQTRLPADPLLPEGEPIGIIDDLVVDANPWLRDVIVEQRTFPDEVTLGEHTRHGTEVASVAAWGDVRSLLDPEFDGQPFPLYVARVAQANDRFEAQIHGDTADQLSAALDWLAEHRVRIVVLALGETYADPGPLTSDLSALIDTKAQQHGMVIVTSAGNIEYEQVEDVKSYLDALRDDSARVAAPGTAALSVTATAIAEDDTIDRSRNPHAVALARAGHHAPYARTGPVRGSKAAGRQKPEFSANGGNWAIDTATDNLVTDSAELAVTTLIPPVNGRLFGASTGTSLAAPRVAHELAKIATRYPDASANLLRALLALSGSRKYRKKDRKTPFLSSAYGVPAGDDVLESSGTRVIFTFEGSMSTNSHAVLEIPIPELFATGSSAREISIALAFDPPVRRSRKDYIAGNMEFVFVQRQDLAAIKEAFARQPRKSERDENPDLVVIKAISGRAMEPPKTTFLSDTLMRRTYYSPSGGWDPNDEDYFLVITHEHSRWTDRQKKQYTEQSFAVAVEIRDHDRLDIDLYTEAQARLVDRARSRNTRSQ
ncbi:S8 family serine peptidase [Microbacterium sp. NPDC089698]|uniref:S8 family serine peptidase n=1 Tax=Microbacterium sp. NPDC089698 TaxID=3364200 RepID=UPI00382FE075